MKIASLVVFGWLCILILACSTKPVPEAKVDQRPTVQFTTSELDEYFAQRFPPNEPGGAVLVMQGDSILFSKGYGLSNLQTKESATTKTLFNLGSISKTFVANAILILQERGKLSVDDNLLKYFQEFRNKEIAQKVKIRHLLTHTSGLPDIRYPWKDSTFYLTAKDAENWAPIMKVDKLNFEPGSRFEYSNPGFNALALIIEKVCGKKWQSFVMEEILNPSGMLTSTITDGPHPQTGVAHAYIKSKGQWMEKDYGEEPTFAAAGNGGVWSSVEELALYEKALRKEVFLKSEVNESFPVKEFSYWSSENSPSHNWVWSMGKTKDGSKVIWHSGTQGGFRAMYAAVPDKQWLVVILTSSPHPINVYTDRAFDFLRTGK